MTKLGLYWASGECLTLLGHLGNVSYSWFIWPECTLEVARINKIKPTDRKKNFLPLELLEGYTVAAIMEKCNPDCKYYT